MSLLSEQKTNDQDNQNNKNTLWNKSFIFLVLISFITAMGFNMVYTIISKYAMEMQDSLAIAGVISGIFSIAALVVRPFAGMTVDTFNKKTLCIIANILIGASVLGYAFSPSIPVLFVFRVLHGIAFGISSTANIALVTGFIPKERLGEGIGYYGIGQVLSAIIGPYLGVSIAEKSGFEQLFIIITILSFIAAALLFMLPYPKSQEGQKKSKAKFSMSSMIAKEVIVYTIIGGIFSFGNGIVSAFLILLGQARNISNTSLFFSVGAIVLFVLRLFVGRFVDKQGLTLTVNISLVVSAISMFLIGVAPTIALLVVASVLKSIGQGGGQISLQAECIKRVDPCRVGVATSTFYIGADIGQGLGPILGGEISARFSYATTFYMCAAIIMASMVLFNLYQRKISRQAAVVVNPE